MSDPNKPEPTADPYVSRIDRRTTLAWLGGAGAVALVGGAVAMRGHKGARTTPSAAKGYGADPNLMKPTAPWPRVMTQAQLQTTALICDFILPASATAPAATTLGVPDFINEWVSAPYPIQIEDQPVIVGGLKWVETEAQKRHDVDLLHAAPADRAALLATLAKKPSDPAMVGPHAFFRRFRSLTIGAYYSTDVGFKEIGYNGNVPMSSYPGPSDEVKAALDRQLKTLGL